jgi:hypothetical protein
VLSLLKTASGEGWVFYRPSTHGMRCVDAMVVSSTVGQVSLDRNNAIEPTVGVKLNCRKHNFSSMDFTAAWMLAKRKRTGARLSRRLPSRLSPEVDGKAVFARGSQCSYCVHLHDDIDKRLRHSVDS